MIRVEAVWVVAQVRNLITIRQFVQLIPSSASYQCQMVKVVFSAAFSRDLHLYVASVSLVGTFLREFALQRIRQRGGPWCEQPRSCFDKAASASSLLIPW